MSRPDGELLAGLIAALRPVRRLRAPGSRAAVGRLAAAAFNDPDRYIGQAIELAGDAVTRGELVGAMRKAGLRPAISLKVPSFLRGKVPAEYEIMMRWIADSGFQADIPALRSQHRGLITVPEWARRVAA